MVQPDTAVLEGVTWGGIGGRSAQPDGGAAGLDEEQIGRLSDDGNPQRLGIKAPGAGQIGAAQGDVVRARGLDADAHCVISCSAFQHGV